VNVKLASIKQPQTALLVVQAVLADVQNALMPRPARIAFPNTT